MNHAVRKSKLIMYVQIQFYSICCFIADHLTFSCDPTQKLPIYINKTNITISIEIIQAKYGRGNLASFQKELVYDQ